MLAKRKLSLADFVTSITSVGEQSVEMFCLNMASHIGDGLIPEHTTQTTHFVRAVFNYQSIKVLYALEFWA